MRSRRAADARTPFLAEASSPQPQAWPSCSNGPRAQSSSTPRKPRRAVGSRVLSHSAAPLPRPVRGIDLGHPGLARIRGARSPPRPPWARRRPAPGSTRSRRSHNTSMLRLQIQPWLTLPSRSATQGPANRSDPSVGPRAMLARGSHPPRRSARADQEPAQAGQEPRPWPRRRAGVGRPATGGPQVEVTTAGSATGQPKAPRVSPTRKDQPFTGSEEPLGPHRARHRPSAARARRHGPGRAPASGRHVGAAHRPRELDAGRDRQRRSRRAPGQVWIASEEWTATTHAGAMLEEWSAGR